MEPRSRRQKGSDPGAADWGASSCTTCTGPPGCCRGCGPTLSAGPFAQDRDLFSQSLDSVFIDTTSTYIYWPTETPVRRRGYSRDRMPDQPQVVICPLGATLPT